jgi:hypothetical protein
MVKWFEGFHQRVPGAVKVLGRVFVLRIVAAANMPANQANPQVDPFITQCQAFLTALGVGRDFLD